MTIDNYYNYITLMTFEQLYKFEGKTSISVDTLNELRNALLEEVIVNYKNDDYRYPQEIDRWQGEVSFSPINEQDALKEFLEEYEDYFFLENGKVIIKKGITFEDISELVQQIRINDNMSNRFNIIVDTPKLMRILGITTIEKTLTEYLQIEKQLESLYCKLYTAEDSASLRNRIKALLFIRLSVLTRITQMPSYRIDAFRLVSMNYNAENDNMLYDKYPINLELWNKEFADPDELGDIDDRTYDITQYAIFGKMNNFLYMDKFHEDIDSYYMRNCDFSSEIQIDPLKDYTDMIEKDTLAQERFEAEYEAHPENFYTLHDPSDEFWVLYINYLNNLNRFMSIYGESEELLLAKRRLIYALDKPELMIFDQNNFDRELERTKTVELDEDSFDFIADEIYFMAQEAFMLPSDEYTIRKLILVGTYYALTKDKQLREIIEEFSNDSRYEFFAEIMLNNCANKNPDSLSGDAKKLILKQIDKNTPANGKNSLK